MAVYTHLTLDTVRGLLGPFDVGQARRIEGVPEGSINTIYRVETSTGLYVLRILEDRSRRDALFEVSLLQHLTACGLSVPSPLSATRAQVLIPVQPRKYLSLFAFMPGRELGVFEVEPTHVRQLGRFLALFHRAAETFAGHRPNPFGRTKVRALYDQALALAHGPLHDEVAGLSQELAACPRFDRLPGGVIHGDLFVDNARFVAKKLAGVLDFEMASRGVLTYDLAVCVMDWCMSEDTLVQKRVRALLAGYQSVRPLEIPERRALFDLCRFAALRFIITRILDFELCATPPAVRKYKDYRHFVARLRSLEQCGPEVFDD